MSLKRIAVYAGKGASLAEITAESLRSEIDESAHSVVLVGAADVRNGLVFKESALFVMPGGRDKPWCDDLNGVGTDNIRRFALRHSFLAFCAGGYFAGSGVEYHKGLHDEVIARRELGLFPGTAIGSLVEFGRPYDNTINSVFTPLVTLSDGVTLPMYYHGGAVFRPDPGYVFDAPDSSLVALGRFEELPGKPVCIAQTNHSEGGVSIASGVHFELSSELIVEQLKIIPKAEQHAHIGVTLKDVNDQRRSFLRNVLTRCSIQLNEYEQPQNHLARLAYFLPRPVFEDMSIRHA